MQKRIEPSELFLTERGTVYHLDLPPAALADTVITVGAPDRVFEVTKHFDNIEHTARHREFLSQTGCIGKKRITVIGTGIGPDNIDIVLNEVDALANIDLDTRHIRQEIRSLTIIRLGTSGSLQADIPVDSFVVSTHAIGLDNLMHFYQYPPTGEALDALLSGLSIKTGLAGSAVQPYIVEADEELVSLFSNNYIQGITVTCPGFFGPQGRVLRGPIAFPRLIDALTDFDKPPFRLTNFEMETSAIYGLGKLLGHRCLSISTIVANRVTRTYSSTIDQAVDRMIRQSLDIIESMD